MVRITCGQRTRITRALRAPIAPSLSAFTLSRPWQHALSKTQDMVTCRHGEQRRSYSPSCFILPISGRPAGAPVPTGTVQRLVPPESSSRRGVARVLPEPGAGGARARAPCPLALVLLHVLPGRPAAPRLTCPPPPGAPTIITISADAATASTASRL